MVYKWNGFKYPVDAEIVGREFEKIEQEEGEIAPESVVEKAKSKNSVLHPLFEWDDKKAAEAYRIDRARHVIAHLLIVEEKPETKETITVRAFVSFNEIRQKGRFINIRDAIESKESRAVLLNTALAELSSFQKKYEKFLELRPVFDSIETVKREINYEGT